jgi:hypothetical protein
MGDFSFKGLQQLQQPKHLCLFAAAEQHQGQPPLQTWHGLFCLWDAEPPDIVCYIKDAYICVVLNPVSLEYAACK